MFILLLTYLLISNALTMRKDLSILFSRILIISLFLNTILSFNNINTSVLEKGISIFGGLLHVTLYTQTIIIILLIITILTLTLFFTRWVYIEKFSNIYNKLEVGIENKFVHNRNKISKVYNVPQPYLPCLSVKNNLDNPEILNFHTFVLSIIKNSFYLLEFNILIVIIWFCITNITTETLYLFITGTKSNMINLILIFMAIFLLSLLNIAAEPLKNFLYKKYKAYYNSIYIIYLVLIMIACALIIFLCFDNNIYNKILLLDTDCNLKNISYLMWIPGVDIILISFLAKDLHRETKKLKLGLLIYNRVKLCLVSLNTFFNENIKIFNLFIKITSISILITLAIYVNMEYVWNNPDNKEIYLTSSLLLLCNFITIFIIYNNKKNEEKEKLSLFEKYKKKIKNIVSCKYILLGFIILILLGIFIRKNTITSFSGQEYNILLDLYVIISLWPVVSLSYSFMFLLKKTNNEQVDFYDYLNSALVSGVKNITGEHLIFICCYFLIIRMIFEYITGFFIYSLSIEQLVDMYNVIIFVIIVLESFTEVFMENLNEDLSGLGGYNIECRGESSNSNAGGSNSGGGGPNPGNGGPNLDPASTMFYNHNSDNTNSEKLKDDSFYLRNISCVNPNPQTYEETEHADSTFYCTLGVNIIIDNIIKKNPDTTLNKIIDQMMSRNITCKELHGSFEVKDNILVTKVQPLDLSTPNHNPEVYSLACKLGSLISGEIISNKRGIIFGHDRFQRLSTSFENIKLSSIWNCLTEQEKNLFTRCVKLNPSQYTSLKVKQGQMVLDKNISSDRLGYTIPNFLNWLGLDKYNTNCTRKELASILPSKTPKSISLPEFEYNNSHPDHSNDTIETWFCDQSQARLREISQTKNIEFETLKSRLYFAGVKCKYILKQSNVENGFIVFNDYNSLDISEPNHNPEVYNLAVKLAQLCTNEIIPRHSNIHFSKGFFSKMTLPSRNVTYSQIKDNLTLAEKVLFIRCVEINPTYYKSISIENGEIKPSCNVVSDKNGYTLINNINKLGTDKQISLRSMYKRAALKRSHEMADLD